ncbi:MAG: hypothetical protein KTR31_32005 [Myxococcales bacterium]|nr:hypothetical protein [Myxococcales bacterium]
MNTSILVLWMAGCVNTVRFPPDLWGESWTTTDGWWSGDTGRPDTGLQTDGRLSVSRVLGGCNDAQTTIDYTAITTGWASDATLTIYRESDGRMEHHDMSIMDLDPAGTWDRWQIELEDGVAEGAHVPGINTVIACEEPGNVAYAIRLQDDTQRTSDCVLWGQSRNALNIQLISMDADVSAAGGCEFIEIP